MNNNPSKYVIHLLHEIQNQCGIRRKKNREFFQIAHIVQEKSSKQLHATEQLIRRLEDDKTCLKADIIQLNSRKTSLLSELAKFEDELNQIRIYAEQRRNKKSKRERQYHQFYNVPLISDQYKKKYLRARDKNLDAEERVSELRTTVDSCQMAVNEVAKAISDVQKNQEQITAKQDDLHSENIHTRQLLQDLQEADRFWRDFDEYQISSVEEHTAQLIEIAQRSSLIMSGSNLSNFLSQYKSILFNYENEEAYGDKHWQNLRIDYECTKCRQMLHDWPRLDKVDKTHFLCNACYQQHRQSMIWERKMKDMKGKSQQLMSLPSSSMVSVSSFSSTNTRESKSNGKNAFKDIFKKFKIEKRKSSLVEQIATPLVHS
ncbi:hypothetical protein BDF20DRAFT_844741 [Mycotypha africana]|uniref:uncharacterized protein n=1 Tax=Mycotypha africana TaxID=64632 RepID=UPI002300351A|nr:uncharacterized protein BDF20DRAFT_844741 [Mycotypha africana]KAI8991453.1 hypothetical protein BDF20DRAFT_844741 [Mycotypha africana]